MRINGITNQNNQNFGKLIVDRNPATLKFFHGVFYRGRNNNTQDSFEKTMELFDRIDKETGKIPVYFRADDSLLDSRDLNFKFVANGDSYPSYGSLDYGDDNFANEAIEQLENTYGYFTRRFDIEQAEAALDDCPKEIKTVFNRYC